MRKELKIIGSRDRHVFTATFIRFGFRDGYKGPVKTILLQDVLLDGKIVTDHLWFDLTKGFESADLLPGDVVEFCARVSIYEKGYKGYRNDVIKVFPQNMIRNIIAEPAELKTVRSILKPDIAFTVIRITGFQKITNS